MASTWAKGRHESNGKYPEEFGIMRSVKPFTEREPTPPVERDFAKLRPGGRKFSPSPGHADCSVEEAHSLLKVAAGGGKKPNEGKRQRAVRRVVPKESATKQGWSDLLSEISESSRRIRVARGGRIGSANTRGGLPSLSAAPGEFEAPAPSLAASQLGMSTERPPPPISSGGATSSSARSPRPPPKLAATSPQTSRPPAVAAAAAAAAAAAGGAARSSTAPVPRLRVSPEATAGPGKSRSLAEEEEIWQSYRIDEEKVPEATLALIWRRAVDPKQRDGEIAQLPSIPRLTVTKREVQQLPVVHDIDHWRQVNRHRREQRKLREETEQFTSLGEMLHTLFGERPPPRLRMDGLRSSFQSVLTRNKSSSSVSRWLLARDVPAEGEAPMPPEAGAADDGVDASAPLPAAGFKGVRQRGRRNAVDMGEVEDGLVPEPDMWRRSQGTKLMRGLEALRSVISHGAEEEEVDRALEKVLAGSARVQARCQRKVRRMHERFMAKKWQLSGRLQRRVQRLQLDFQEIHDKKVSLILPGSLLPSSEPSTSTRPEGSDLKASVLTYLKHKRRHVEHDRKTRHATYLHQVERFQSHLRLLADPNRPPERGEVYLSECFRHVLSAGLIVDNDYFFRVIANMDGQDFEGPCTVNLLAACCDAFDIDLRRYWLFLRQKAVPKCTPRPCPENVRSWQEDFAPWCGVTLQDIREVVEQIVPTDSETSGDDIPSSAMDPLPFSPVCPKEVPPSSELVSRDDGPLRSIIDSAPLDSVLERYHLSKGDVRANRAEASARRRSASWSHDGRSRRSSSATSGGTGFMTPGTESEDPEESAMESLAPEVALATEPRPPLGPGAAASEARRALSTQRARRPPPRAYPTLRAAVQLENAASAASRERRRRPPKAADSPPETPVLGPAPEWPRFSPFPERLE